MIKKHLLELTPFQFTRGKLSSVLVIFGWNFVSDLDENVKQNFDRDVSDVGLCEKSFWYIGS